MGFSKKWLQNLPNFLLQFLIILPGVNEVDVIAMLDN